MKEHTFKFTVEGNEVVFECDFDMPCMLFNQLKQVVLDYDKEAIR